MIRAISRIDTNENLSTPKYLDMLVESSKLAIMSNDTDVILHALQKERDDLHGRIMQIDRIMTRIRKIEYAPGIQDSLPVLQDVPVNIDIKADFPKTADIKIQVLRVFDILGKASQLADLQREFTEITGSHYKIREAVRAMHSTGVLKMLKYRNASRGFMWIKRDWIENNELLDKFKPLGFDLLYSKEDLLIV
jgi:hypothetical protein